MGYMRDNAIIVTGYYGEYIDNAHKRAKKIFGEQVSEITPEATNGARSFFVAPDGSKEGWKESNIGDENREAFVKYLENRRYSDGSSPLNLVEVQYGDDELETKIINDSDEYRRNKR